MNFSFLLRPLRMEAVNEGFSLLLKVDWKVNKTRNFISAKSL